jgi:mono/diheme cytochrome c family protein
MMFRSLTAGALALSLVCTSAAAMSGYRHPAWRMGPKWSEIDRLPRHHAVATTGVPEPYASLRNPLPASRATIERGARVYAQACASCHGRSGKGDGPTGRRLVPPPGDLAWLSEMRISQSDGFMYWTVAEGGTALKTAMPPFKDSLSPDDIWAVTTYIQVHLLRKR